ncbi:MAG: adenosylcobinamide amidohydrolase [Deltaproteobacteria bacterium]|nr:MAG: adenosylcobinamide amidohydrolase [Deltaproteobacteria bacterium]
MTADPPWLVADLGVDHDVISHAVVGGGLGRARRVAWLQVCDADLPPGVDPAAWLHRRLEARSLPATVGLLTASNIAHHRRVARQVAGVTADAVVTVGLANRLRVGDLPTPLAPGTINALVVLDHPLRTEALIEALAIAVEARTAAVSALNLASPVSGRPATGTGTDCVVVAAPGAGLAADARMLPYSGKHTPAGAAIGRAVYDAVLGGGRAWIARQR